MERFLRIFLSSFFWKYPSEQKHVRVNSKKDTGTASGLCSFTTGLRTQIFIKNRYKTLHKKSPCSELFWSLFFPYSDWIRRDTEHLSVFSPNAGKCGKFLRSETQQAQIYQFHKWVYGHARFIHPKYNFPNVLL